MAGCRAKLPNGQVTPHKKNKIFSQQMAYNQALIFLKHSQKNRKTEETNCRPCPKSDPSSLQLLAMVHIADQTCNKF